MSIGYDSKVVIYNQTGGELGNPRKWYGAELSNVRVELVNKLSASTGGTTSSTTCTIKIYDKDLSTNVVSPSEWEEDHSRLTFGKDTVFVITNKADIGRAVTVPLGEIDDKSYAGGFLAHLQTTYGMTYKVTSVEHYSLIPHWAVSGA